MRGCRVTMMVGLAILTLLASRLLAYEALSEDELDRTVASGVEPVTTVDAPAPQGDQGDVHEDVSVASAPTVQEAEQDTTVTENAEPDPEAEFTLVAFREALPIVMNRMTAVNNGPLGANGNYSLPLGSPNKLPVSPVSLKLGPLPSRSVLFGR